MSSSKPTILYRAKGWWRPAHTEVMLVYFSFIVRSF